MATTTTLNEGIDVPADIAATLVSPAACAVNHIRRSQRLRHFSSHVALPAALVSFLGVFMPLDGAGDKSANCASRRADPLARNGG